ncbi:MAG: DNA polymerase I, partial [Clostridia bacterium]|nr:DNA polymerase I [Clostridia bacterium]
MKKMLLVDGNSIMNNCFFGMPLLSADDGVYTNAVVGTVNVLIKYLKDLSPEYCAIAFDVHEPTFRHKAYAEYKAGRHKMPEELVPQFPLIKECADALGIRIIEAPGYEADDILGTCASWADAETEAYIITGDKDAFQLIRDNVFVLYKGRNGISPIGREEFSGRYPGVTPETFPDFKALLGDTSDNIKGVAGIGEKSALELVSEYGTLENIYENIHAIKSAWAKKLDDGRDEAFFSRFLARIKCDSPIGADLEGIKYYGIDAKKCEKTFSELRMSKALEACREISGNEAVETALSKYPSVEYTETFSTDICGRFCALDGETLYDGKHRFILSRGDMASLLSDSMREIAVTDGKKLISEFGRTSCAVFDVPLAAYVVDSSKSDPDLSHLAMKYFGATLDDSFDSAKLIYDLALVLKKKLKDTSQDKIYVGIELPLISVLADMEKTGFRVDREGLSGFSAELGRLADDYMSEIYRYCGHEFNINSPKQLGKVLFEELGLPQGKKTQSGFSTNIEVLEKIRAFHPVVDRIIDYRKVAKLRSTYTEGLLTVADRYGRIHSTFNQKIAATGRLSSSEPNLQNIPVRTELGRRMRKYFIADDGYVLVDA